MPRSSISKTRERCTGVMRITRRVVLSLLCLFAIDASAWAHSLEELEKQLFDQEKYFQAVDSDAPDFALQDADGKTVRLSDFRGKVVVLHFIYINCPDVCPLHAERIAEIQSMVNITPMKSEVEFITITTDPKRDRGQALRDYGAAHSFDRVNWTFLTAAPDQPEDTTRKIAKAYGLDFTDAHDGAQMHGIVTHVIDQGGRLRARFHGLGFKSLNLVIFVNALVNKIQVPHEHAGPSLWSKLINLF
jgi:protein SCO1